MNTNIPETEKCSQCNNDGSV